MKEARFRGFPLPGQPQAVCVCVCLRFCFEGTLFRSGSSKTTNPSFSAVLVCLGVQVSDFLQMEGPPESHCALLEKGLLHRWHPDMFAHLGMDDPENRAP